MEDIRELLKKLWSGEASELEKIKLYKLIAQDMDTCAIYSFLEMQFMQSDEPGKSEKGHLEVISGERILDALHKKMDMPARRELQYRKVIKVNSWISWVSAACLFSVFLLLWNQKDRQVKHHSLARHNVHHYLFTDSTVINVGNSKLHVTLPDNSSIELEKNSSITFKKDMLSRKRRTVKLEGAASFSVRHDRRHLFEVLAQSIRTIDIGTVFNIDASTRNNIKIWLRHGAIKVEALEGSVMHFPPRYLQPGEELIVDLTSRNVSFSHWNRNSNSNQGNRKATDTSIAQFGKQQLYDQYMDSYTDIKFTGDSLAAVFKKMAVLYHVKDIRLQSSVPASKPFMGTLLREDPLGKALDIICKISGLSYTVDRTGTIRVYKPKNKY